jgi:hypothetical protein
VIERILRALRQRPAHHAQGIEVLAAQVVDTCQQPQHFGMVRVRRQCMRQLPIGLVQMATVERLSRSQYMLDDDGAQPVQTWVHRGL